MATSTSKNNSNSRVLIAGAAMVAVVLVAALAWTRQGDEQPSGPVARAVKRGDASRPSISRRGELTEGSGPARARLAAVNGVVHDLEGRGIGGAQVCARRPDVLVLDGLGARCVTSDADGRFRVESLVPGAYSVSAAAAEHQPRAVELALAAGAERRVELTLLPGGVALRGVVHDLSGGPIERAMVAISGDELRGDPSDIRGLALTDADGRFTAWTRRGRARVVAYAAGYTTRSVFSAAPGPTVELYLTPESSLVGVVVDAETGARLEGIDVFRGVGGGGAFMNFTAVGEGAATTDARGEFRITGLQPGIYRPYVLSARWRGYAAQSVRLGLGEASSRIEIAVSPAALVRARVVDAGTGEPACAAGSVTASPAPFEIYFAELDGEGRVALEGLGPGDYKVSVNCQGRAGVKDAARFTIRDGGLVGGDEELEWPIERGLSVRGVVVEEGGAPAAGVVITAAAEDGRRLGLGRPRSSATGRDGVFSIAGLEPGVYELRPGGSDAPQLDEPVVVELRGRDVEGIQLELPQRAILEGAVKTASGAAAPRVTVAAYAAEGEGQWETISGDDGEFTLASLSAGSYRVVALDGRWNLEVAEAEVELRAGARGVTTLEIPVQDGLIAGRVRDSGGTPISDAFITVERQRGALDVAPPRGRLTYGDARLRPVLTDLDGSFEVTVELLIQDTGVIAGTIARADGAPVTDYTITASLVDGSFEFKDRWREGQVAWRLEDIPPGRYTIAAESGALAGSVELALEPGETARDVTLELAPQDPP